MGRVAEPGTLGASELVPKIGRRYPSAMILESIPDVNRLTPAQKLLLVSELWDDLAAHPSEIPVSREQIAELDRRMEDYRRDPARSPHGSPSSSASSARLSAVSELVVLFSADADIQTAFEFHEGFQAGRGEVFMRDLDVAFGQLRTFPEIFACTTSAPSR